MTTEAQQTQAPATEAATQAAQPIPGSPEHRAAMIAAYDAQFKQQTSAESATTTTEQPATQAQTATQQQLPSDQGPPKLTDDPSKPEGEKTPGTAEKKEGETPTEVKTLGDLYTSGELVTGFNAEQVPEPVVNAFKAAGLDDDAIKAMHEQFRAGQLALQREQTATLHKAAGGAEQFNALVAWGQKNLTMEQRQFFDTQLNNPATAADAIALLRQRMTAGRDPSLAVANSAAAPVVTGFRDKAEMVAAMSHPDYQKSEAYRADVQRKLAASKF